MHGCGSCTVPHHEPHLNVFDCIQSLVSNLYVVRWSIISEIAFYSFHRRRLKEYLDTSGTKTRVLKVLALFIESGSVYCAILVS